MLKINPEYKNQKAKDFCESFISSDRPKYIFGRNTLADSIARIIEVDGYIDEFTDESTYKSKPIIPIERIPSDALVVMVITGKPFTAEKRVKQYQFDSIDYFSFYKYSKLDISKIMFWEGMIEDINKNKSNYEWVYSKLNDSISKNQFYNIINFRLSYDIDYMRGFEDKEEKQYFEHFLNLKDRNEVFVDVGAFDGYTSKEFIKISPNYSKIFIFEPELKNLNNVKAALKKFNNITYFPVGLSNKEEVLSFDVNGSSSKISNTGTETINVNTLDNFINEKVTFIKMDIEGAEQAAIKGAKNTIKNYHPKMAISVYHQANDFWKIPQLVMSIRDDYDIYLRHYTEGISETIMFFIPVTKKKNV